MGSGRLEVSRSLALSSIRWNEGRSGPGQLEVPVACLTGTRRYVFVQPLTLHSDCQMQLQVDFRPFTDTALIMPSSQLHHSKGHCAHACAPCSPVV